MFLHYKYIHSFFINERHSQICEGNWQFGHSGVGGQNVRIDLENRVRVKLLVFSVLLGLVVAPPPAGPPAGPTAPTTATTTKAAPGPPSTSCTKKGWTFACQVYEWEQANNKQEPKHPFSKLNEDYVKQNCPDADKCTNDCDFDAADIKPALLKPDNDVPIKCDLTRHICRKKSQRKCVHQLEVEVLESDQSAPDVTTTTTAASTTTTAASTTYTGTPTTTIAASTTGSGGTKTKRESPEETTRVRREMVKTQTLIFPVRTLSMDPATYAELLEWHILCKLDAQGQRDTVFCLITEVAWAAAADGDSLEVWKYTGLPHDVVTDSRVTNLLPGRPHTLPAAFCGRYKPIENCRPLPICDGVLDAANCEMPCGLEHMAIKEKPKGCRIFDVQGYPFERQNYGPYATWMTEAQNLDNMIFKINETAWPTAVPPDAKEVTTLPAYPRPVNLSSISERAYQKKIAANYWLYDKTNPFFSKHPGVGYVQVPKCSSNDDLKTFLDKVYSNHPENRPEFCDSDPLVTSNNLMLYVIIGVVVTVVLILSIILVVAFTWSRLKKSSATQSEEQKDGGDGTTSKSGAVDGGTSQAGAV